MKKLIFFLCCIVIGVLFGIMCWSYKTYKTVNIEADKLNIIVDEKENEEDIENSTSSNDISLENKMMLNIAPFNYSVGNMLEEIKIPNSSSDTSLNEETNDTENNKNNNVNNDKKDKHDTLYTDEDLYVLSHVIYAEAGECSWEHQIAAGSVVLNRVKDNRYPNTIKKVVFQKGQYACTWDGNYYKTPSKKSVEVATYLLKNGSQLPEYIIFQATFPQGDTIYKKIDNTYFCYWSKDVK